jgi:predicted amidohydrolase
LRPRGGLALNGEDIDGVRSSLLLAGEARGEAGTWVRLAEALLRRLRRDGRWLAAGDQERRAAVEAVGDLLPEVVLLLGEELSGQVDPRIAARLCDWFDQAMEAFESVPADLGHIVACRVLVLAIDEVVYPTALADWFRADGSLELRPDAIYPLVAEPFDPRPYLPGSPNSDALPLEDERIDQTPHLRLGSDETRSYRFVLDWDAYDHLASVADKDQLRIAACQPNVDRSEFDVEWPAPPLPGSEDPTFRNGGPKDPGGQTRVLLEQLERAAENEADIVIYPEYTVLDEHRQALGARLQQLERRPSIVVGGSCEACLCDDHDDGPCIPVNQAALWIADGVHPLLKLIPAAVDRATERIDTSHSHVKVFISHRWVLAVLICRDALSPDILTQLETLRVNLLLVPAMSGKTTTLAQRVTGMTGRTQAFTALAVAPALWGEGLDETRLQSAFSAPYGDRLAPLEAPPPEERPLGSKGVWLFDTRRQDVHWLPLDG